VQRRRGLGPGERERVRVAGPGVRVEAADHDQGGDPDGEDDELVGEAPAREGSHRRDTIGLRAPRRRGRPVNANGPGAMPGPSSRAECGGYLIMIAASRSTCAHFAPVLHAPGFSGLFLPSTVTVTVWVPAAMAARAHTTRPPLIGLAEYRSTTS